MKKICVIGQGYIGIPTAFILAEKGFEVIGIDKDKSKIELLNQGKLPFHEQEFTDFAKNIFENKKYKASLEIEKADVFIICVPTPFTSDKKCDYKYIISAAESIFPVLEKENLVVLESTVPAKTCEEVLRPILEKSGLKANRDFFISHAPERLIPGNILHEIINNDRIIGGLNEKATQMTNEIYKTFSKGEILLTDAKTAEMCKLMENTFRDVNIALANEFALICEKLKIDVYEATRMANRHPRVNIHSPGPGVGGHCISIDPWFIVEKAPELAKLITLSRNINDAMPSVIVEKIVKMTKDIDDPNITLLGAAYKPNVDDPRKSPTKTIAKLLENKGYQFKVYDPLLKKFAYPLSDFENAFNNSDCLVFLQNHDIFADFDVNKIEKIVRNKNVLFAGNFKNEEKYKSIHFKISKLGI